MNINIQRTEGKFSFQARRFFFGILSACAPVLKIMWCSYTRFFGASGAKSFFLLNSHCKKIAGRGAVLVA